MKTYEQYARERPLYNQYRNARHKHLNDGLDFEFRNYDDFEDYILTFLGPKPEDHVLGRKDKTEGYFPGNLQWETPQERSNNVPVMNHTYTYKRQTLPIAEWSRRLEIPYYSLRRRLIEGWPMNKIIKHYQKA